MKKNKSTVAVALSGGIDSFFAAEELKHKGWDVTGVHLLLSLPSAEREKKVSVVRSICRRLNIPLFLFDVVDLFQERIIEYFTDSYLQGLTPNPCVVCNHMVKFEEIIKWIDKNSIEYLATGHYARVKKGPDKKYVELLRGRDKGKDQSYFLHRLNQSHLSRTIFPLGDLTKAEIYSLTKEKVSSLSIQPESQDVCFIPGNNYRLFLEKQKKENIRLSGNIVDLQGEILGKHSGVYAFTIGQRHGLGISAKEPLYVCRINSEANEVVVGPRESLFTSRLTITDFNWTGVQPKGKNLRVKAQIRYRHQAVDGALVRQSQHIFEFEFDQPQWAITPGQALVCYEGEKVLGGGWIERM